MERINISTGTPWEEQVGYSRVVRKGQHVFATGTLAADATGALQHAGDPYGQTVFALRKVEAAMKQVGATLADVVRTRMFILDMADADAIGRAHRDVLGEVRPATTMVVVAGLFIDGAVVEIEADAIVD